MSWQISMQLTHTTSVAMASEHDFDIFLLRRLPPPPDPEVAGVKWPMRVADYSPIFMVQITNV